MQPHSNAKGPPRLIGLAGPSGAGKTTLARALQIRLPGSATVLSLDCVLPRLSRPSPQPQEPASTSTPPRPWTTNASPLISANSPPATASKSPCTTLLATRAKRNQQSLTPTDFLLVEGLFALYWPDINALYHLRIFVAAADALAWSAALPATASSAAVPPPRSASNTKNRSAQCTAATSSPPPATRT